MIITVYGPGCARCTEAEKLVKSVVAEKNAAVTVEKVSDLKAMMAAGILSTPAVAVDGVLKMTGRIPTKAEVAAWIDGAPAGAAPQAPTAGGCCCGGKC